MEKTLEKPKGKKLEQKLKGLLYKKGMLEHQIKVAETGANLSCAYVTKLENRIKEIKDSTLPDHDYQLDYYKLQYELFDVKRVASDYISDFKEFTKRYEDGLIIEIRKTVEAPEFEKMEFENVKEKAEALVQYELFGQVEVEPENIEHPKIIDSIEECISLLDKLITATRKELETNKNLSELAKAKLEKELFDYSLHGQTLQKRLFKRKEYYLNQFIPVFNKDMAECDIHLESYLETARTIAELRIDPLMPEVLKQYEKHKGEREQLWLFFTALRTRLTSIAQEVHRNKKKFPKVVECLKQFV